MSNISYNMTLDEVFREIFETEGWYQGEDFGDGVYMTVAPSGCINVYVFSEHWCGAKDMGAFLLTKGSYTEKYRRVYTRPQVERKC